MILASAFLKQIQNQHVALNSLYLIYGEEGLFLRDCSDALRGFLQAQGYLFSDRYEVDAGFDWQTLQMETQAGSLFSEQRVVLLSMPKGNPGKEGGKFIQDWANLNAKLAQVPPEVIVVIECEKLDSRQTKAKWFQAIESAGLVIQAKPVPTNMLPGWCQQRAQQQGLQLEGEAAALLAERVEGNLLAADQELIKLSLIHPENTLVTAQMINESVVDQAHYQLFALATAMLEGRKDYALQILQRLRQEGVEAPIILWLLAKEIRQLLDMTQLQQSMPRAQAFKQLRIWQSRQAEVTSALQRHAAELWPELIKQALQVDLMIKGVKKTLNEDEIWMGLSGLVAQVAR